MRWLYPSNLVLVDDLVSYHAVGARSVEDQEHRFVASGIDAPVGMKNPTSGNLGVMFNGIYAAQNKQTFLFHGQEVETSGNPLAHVILRGAVNEYGKNEPNFYYETLLNAIERYEAMGLENPLSSSIPTMITQASNIWSRFELFARLCKIVIGMRRLKRQFEAL